MMAGDGKRTTIDDLLAAARARLDRLSAREALAATGEGAVIVDIRPQEQRRRTGVVPGALYFPRNHLEWRIDPASEWAHPAVSDPATRIVLMCNEGYATSLAAVTLHELGFTRATDMIDGFDGWRAAGLPIEPFDELRHAYDRPWIAGHDD
jgi:rhodanese-related sulfurtransferase